MQLIEDGDTHRVVRDVVIECSSGLQGADSCESVGPVQAPFWLLSCPDVGFGAIQEAQGVGLEVLERELCPCAAFFDFFLSVAKVAPPVDVLFLLSVG